MKKTNLILATCTIALLAITSCNNTSKTKNMNENKTEETIFPKGVKATVNFIGDAYVNTLVPKTDSNAYAVGDVIFEPGSRNNWHTHQVRQVLLVTEGKGWYQEKGKEAKPLKKGDVLVIPTDTEHWHGATRKDRLVHIVITDYRGDDCVVWLNPVTDEEYDSLPASFDYPSGASI